MLKIDIFDIYSLIVVLRSEFITIRLYVIKSNQSIAISIIQVIDSHDVLPQNSSV